MSDKRVIALERLTDEEWSFNGTHVKASLLALSNHEYHVLLKGVSYRVQVESLNAEDKSVSLLVNGKRVALQGKGRYEALLSSLGMDILTSSKAKDLKAPMPGLVIDIAVQQGQQVSAGDNLIILEAMKMENIIKADSPGIIKEIKVSAKDSVEKNQVLITFED